MILRKSVRYACTILFADTIGVIILSIVMYRSLFHLLTILTLLEAALLFMVGGALDFSRSFAFRRVIDCNKPEKRWTYDHYKQQQASVVPYIVAGVLLFLLSVVLAYLPLSL